MNIDYITTQFLSLQVSIRLITTARLGFAPNNTRSFYFFVHGLTRPRRAVGVTTRLPISSLTMYIITNLMLVRITSPRHFEVYHLDHLVSLIPYEI